VTFDDFQRFGIHRAAIAPAIREVVALGFACVTPGRAGNAEYRQPNRFRLTYRPTDHAEPTHEWRKLADADHAAIAKVARKDEKGTKSKTFSSAGKRTGFGAGFRTAKPLFHSTETGTTAIVRKPALLSISREGTSTADGKPVRLTAVVRHAPSPTPRRRQSATVSLVTPDGTAAPGEAPAPAGEVVAA
jgi:hypothetical protein